MTVKIHYFNATGRGQQIRLALAAGGVEFEDVTAAYPPTPEDKAKWNKLTNNNTTFGVPILTIDEGTEQQKVYIQSSAALRKAGRMGDLKMTLENDEDGDQAMYLTDRAIADAEDLRTQSYRSFVIFGASKEAADKFAKQTLPKHVDNLERQLVQAGGDYWGGSSTISLADVAVYDAVVNFGLNLIKGIEGVQNPSGPALTKWIERVESNERIKAYLEGEQFEKIAGKFTKSVLGY